MRYIITICGPVYEIMVLLLLFTNEGLGESEHICVCKTKGTLFLVSFCLIG